MAYEQWQQNPQGIESMFNSNVSDGGGTIAATPSLMQLLGQQQHADMLTGQDQQRQLSQNYAMDPLRVQNQDLTNQGLQAELPGKTANSMILQSKAAIDQALQPSAITAGVAKNGKEATGAHADELGNVGTMLQQHAANIESNPLGTDTKGFFDSIGHPELYNPALENLDPSMRAQVLRTQGQQLQDASAKSRLTLQGIDLKNQGALGVAQTKGAFSLMNQQEKTRQVAMQSKARVDAAKVPRGLEMLQAEQTQAAEQAKQNGDEESAAYWQGEAYKTYVYKANIAGAGAQAGQESKIDYNLIQSGGIGSRNPARPSIPTPAAPTAPAARTPAAAQPAGPAASGSMLSGKAEGRPTIPQSSPGHVVIYKNGQAVGQVEIKDAEKALSKGYKLTP